MKAALDYYEEYLQGEYAGIRAFSPVLYQTYLRIVEGAGEDLLMLAREGVHPKIVLAIMIDDQIFGGANEVSRSNRVELRRLSSSRYWLRGRRFLETANEFLSDLASHACVRSSSWARVDERFPFIELSKYGMQAASAVGDLLKTIERLGLDQDGWKLQPASNPPRHLQIVRHKKTGRKCSGRGPEDDWGFCATMLHELIRRRTGSPHWGVIARLLHFARYKGFPRALPPEGAKGSGDPYEAVDRWGYKAKIRRRVRNKLKAPRVVEVVNHNLRIHKSDLQRLGHSLGYIENLVPSVTKYCQKNNIP